MASIYKVNPNELIERVAEQLKSFDEIEAPSWASFVKTGHSKERPPIEKDWWYIRFAAVLRSIYKLGPIGVSKLRTKYGGRKNRGVRPSHFYKGSGNILRKILQQGEKAGLLKQVEKGVHKGRILTPKGISLLDKAAVIILKDKPIKPVMVLTSKPAVEKLTKPVKDTKDSKKIEEVEKEVKETKPVEKEIVKSPKKEIEKIKKVEKEIVEVEKVEKDVMKQKEPKKEEPKKENKEEKPVEKEKPKDNSDSKKIEEVEKEVKEIKEKNKEKTEKQSKEETKKQEDKKEIEKVEELVKDIQIKAIKKSKK